MADGEPPCVSVHRLCVTVVWMYSARGHVDVGSAVANPAMACCTKGLAVPVCTVLRVAKAVVRAQIWDVGR